MEKRRLKRQLNLAQVVMLGTAGAIGAQIFLLIGHGAGMAGPALILAILIGGLLSYPIALNYGEMASSFPVTGGAMTYVREAWGKNLLSYLVGSLDCLSSTFLSALSAIGFAYTLRVIFPLLPIIPAAIGIILIFTVLNLLGVSNVGNAQILLGGLLLLALFAYILLGFILPGGFQWNTYLVDGRFFIHETSGSNLITLISTVALTYVAYIGFEVIADDAEEIKNPDRHIPFGILISLTLCLLLYSLITLVTLGTIPWTELAGSDAALTDAAERFLPGIGPLILALAGVIATTTTLNSSMLSATREAFTLSRYGMWPRFLSALGRFRTPYAATLFIGGIICAVAAIGLVEFLSYISASGYLFVLFWSNLALIRLRKRYPDLRRPFRVPLFPVTAYLAMGTCFLIIAFTEKRALAFGVGLLAVLSALYYLSPVVSRIYANHVKTAEKLKNRILVPVANPQTGATLVHLAAILAQAMEDTSVCVFHVEPLSAEPPALPETPVKRQKIFSRALTLPDQIAQEVRGRNVPLYTKICQSGSISKGILDEIDAQQNVKMILAGWPGPIDPHTPGENPVQILVEKAQTSVAVLLPRNLGKIRHILVPIGGGLHSRLALHLAYEIAEQENAKITALRIFHPTAEAEEVEDAMLNLRQILVEELGLIPLRVGTRVTPAESVQAGVLDEAKRHPCDLLVMGASEEYGSGTRLFGSVDDWIIAHVENCSVLLARHHEAAGIHWIRRHLKMIEKEY